MWRDPDERRSVGVEASARSAPRRPRSASSRHRRRGRARGRRSGSTRQVTSTSSQRPSGDSVDLRPRLRVGVLGPHHRVARPTACRAGGGAPCGGTRRPRDTACRRSREPSGSHATLHARVSGISSSAVPAGVPSMPETTRSVERSVPPSLVPMATREPSRDGREPVDGVGGVGRLGAGSASVTAATPASAAERRASRNCSAPVGRSTVNRWSPRRVASSTTGSCISATRRSCQRARPGRASIAERVKAFWAATQAITSGSSPSSSQR